MAKLSLSNTPCEWRDREAHTDEDEIKQFLNACYGGTGPNGESGIEVTGGTNFGNLDKLEKTKLLSTETLEYYAEQYSRNGMQGTCEFHFGVY